MAGSAAAVAALALALAAGLLVAFGLAGEPQRGGVASEGQVDRPLQPGPAPRMETAAGAHAKLPLAFVPNRGQTDARVRYAAQAGGASFWFTPREAVISLAKGKRGVLLRLGFAGANRAPVIAGDRRLPATVNYLLGRDSSAWRTGLRTYEELVYRDLWPGVNLHFRGRNGTLKYEFHVAPGASPDRIGLAYRGAERLALGPAGDLRIHTGLGILRDSRPVSYQLVRGARVPVETRYVFGETGGYGFALGSYDRSRPLVIDPGLVYSTLLGGASSDGSLGIAVGAAGSSYVTGHTASNDFPTTAGAFDVSRDSSFDVFVSKLDGTGSALVYSTFLGGSGWDEGTGVAVDDAGNVSVAGMTDSAGFPTTAGAFDTSWNGSFDAFAAKLNATGSALLYSTFLGGFGYDQGHGIAVDAAGSAYVTGGTDSSGFPATAGAFDTTRNGSFDAFVTKLNATGSALLYSTFLGGSSSDAAGGGIAVDAAGSAYVVGHTFSTNFPTTAGAFDTSHNGSADVFASKLNATGSALVTSTYLGGSGGDQGHGIAVDAAGSVYVTGTTSFEDFPTTAGAFAPSRPGGFDGYVAKLNATSSALVYSTYLGGSQSDSPEAIAVDASGNAYLTGSTQSADYPTTAGALDTRQSGSAVVDGFVTKLDASGSSLLYSTFLTMGVGRGIAVDAAGPAYVAGSAVGTDFPTTPGAFDTSFNGFSDAFVAKLDIVPLLVPAALTLSPAAATNTVGTSHAVTATVEDAAGNPVPDVLVRFSVTGSVTVSGTCTTEETGTCGFAYTGPELPGADLISAYCDSDEDEIEEVGEPAGEATKSWVLPASTAGEATGGGQIDDSAGNKVAFGFSATSDDGLDGRCTVVDRAVHRLVKCLDVTALVINGNQVAIYGNATDDGVATTYVIQATDNGEPGRGADTFAVSTASGYRADGTLSAGNVDVGS